MTAWFRRWPLPTSTCALLALAAAGCGGSGTPPSGLTYTMRDPTYVAGQAVTPNVPSHQGGTPTLYAIVPDLPEGLVIDSRTGVIDGTPACGAPLRSYSVVASNAAGSTTAALSISVQGVVLEQACRHPEPDADGACTYPNRCPLPLPGGPFLDVATAQLDLRFPLQFSNSFLVPDPPVTAGVSDASVQWIDAEFPGSGLPAATFAADFVIPAGGAAAPPLPILPARYFPTLLETFPGGIKPIDVRVRARGVLGSREPFASSWLSMTVNLCAHCLEIVCGSGTAFSASCPPPPAGAVTPGQSGSIVCVPAP
jgi:hypothetical protein